MRLAYEVRFVGTVIRYRADSPVIARLLELDALHPRPCPLSLTRQHLFRPTRAHRQRAAPKSYVLHTASTKEARAKWTGSIMEVRCNAMRCALSLHLLCTYLTSVIQPRPTCFLQEHSAPVHTGLR